MKLATINVKEHGAQEDALGNRIAQSNPANNSVELSKPDAPIEGLQQGVQDVESVTRTWSKKTLIAVFLKYVVLLWNHIY
jgi:hypothetical protein